MKFFSHKWEQLSKEIAWEAYAMKFISCTATSTQRYRKENSKENSKKEHTLHPVCKRVKQDLSIIFPDSELNLIKFYYGHCQQHKEKTAGCHQIAQKKRRSSLLRGFPPWGALEKLLETGRVLIQISWLMRFRESYKQALSNRNLRSKRKRSKENNLAGFQTCWRVLILP